VTYIECNDADGYEQFCQRMMDTYAGTTDPVVAERVVKNCLLRPASEPLLRALTPFADLTRQSMSGRDFAAPEGEWWPGWRCLSLALLEYRSGNWMDAAIWSRRCSNYGPPLPRSAAGQAILAMALFRSGQVDEARSELGQVRTLVTTRFSSELQPFEGNAFWFDWVLARILMREAETVLGQ
jgi:hypothetical protein